MSNEPNSNWKNELSFSLDLIHFAAAVEERTGDELPLEAQLSRVIDQNYGRL